MKDKTTSILAAKLARQLLAKQISYKQFVDEYPDDIKDNDIDKLFSLIEHEPKVGGLLGVSKIKHEQYMSQIVQVIELLEKEA
ncbi:MAG TPA: hypothetical protein VN922_06155 [Bacteroidia bacterium]|nr:hypothetical protein [Bacteroidia bacterium]